MIAQRFPETGLVFLDDAQAAQPLGALPEVQVRNEQPHWPTVLQRQRQSVVGVDNPSLVAGYIGER
jgi:hypothetical protein